MWGNYLKKFKKKCKEGSTRVCAKIDELIDLGMSELCNNIKECKDTLAEKVGDTNNV